MKRCLVDVNVVLALLVPRHEHHGRAMRWFDALAAGEAGLCRFVQLAVVRLLANRVVMGTHAVPPAAGWAIVEELLGDERLELAGEPAGIDSLLPELLRQRRSGSQVVSDAYLAAFALASSRGLVTMDAGFRNFRGLELELL
jgi:toxin-antitoxin system PIN domain toxin